VTGLAVRASVESRCVDVEFEVTAGEVLAIVGPNGAGKSTIVHIVAGLLRPDHGVVRCGDRTLTDTATGVQVPAHDRRVGLLMQDPLLFPHLSVAGNVAFSPRTSRAAATRWLARLGVEELATRMPRQLSGGQAQRVALARALAAEPDVLMLDEPLAGLDVAAATSMRTVLRDVLTRDGRSAVLITHDLLDVLTLADRVIVLESGRISETGSAANILAAPRSHFGARFAGVNLVAGTVGDDEALATGWGERWYGTGDEDLTAGHRAVAVFAPAAVAVYRDEPHGSPRNTVRVTVAELDPRGPTVRVRAEEQPDGGPGLAADITTASAAAMRLAPGETVYFSVKAQEVRLHPQP